MFAKHLGIRERDLKAGLRNGDGTVSPGPNKGGMSVSPTPVFSDPEIAKKISAGKLVVFRIKKTDLAKEGLTLDYDGNNHASIQPGDKMTEMELQSKIRRTRQYWHKYSP